MLTYTAAYSLLSILYFYRFYYAATHGQALEDAVGRMNASLRDNGALLASHTLRRQRVSLLALREKFSAVVPVRPRQAFNLNMGMTISAAGMIVTYIIVLIQFKGSDGSSEKAAEGGGRNDTFSI